MVKTAIGVYVNVFEDEPLGSARDIFIIINEANGITQDDPVLHEVEEIVTKHMESGQTIDRVQLERELDEVCPVGVSVIQKGVSRWS